MNIFLVLATFLLSLNSFASSQTKTFFFDGSQSSVMMTLQAEKTHTEYRLEQRRSTCQRTVVDYQTICSGGPVPQCTTRPVTRVIYYPCTITVSVPYEVKDYDVEAKVNLDVTAFPGGAHSDTFKVTLDGDLLSVSAASSGAKYFVMLNKREISSAMSGSVKFIDAFFKASFIEAAPITKTLEMSDISLKDTLLSFKLGPVAARDAIGFSLEVKKAPILGSNTVLFDRELNASEIQLSSLGEGSAADVNIQRLGVELNSGRYLLTAKAFFKYSGTVLNSSQFETLSASRTLVYKVR
jgi:hypothetical protein